MQIQLALLLAWYGKLEKRHSFLYFLKSLFCTDGCIYSFWISPRWRTSRSLGPLPHRKILTESHTIQGPWDLGHWVATPSVWGLCPIVWMGWEIFCRQDIFLLWLGWRILIYCDINNSTFEGKFRSFHQYTISLQHSLSSFSISHGLIKWLRIRCRAVAPAVCPM